MFTQSLPNAPAMIFAASALAGLVVIAFAALKGWQGWLDLKARELDTRQGHAHEPGNTDRGPAAAPRGSKWPICANASASSKRLPAESIYERNQRQRRKGRHWPGQRDCGGDLVEPAQIDSLGGNPRRARLVLRDLLRAHPARRHRGLIEGEIARPRSDG
jgi:hypothetical protein